jgi:hypothetical protein
MPFDFIKTQCQKEGNLKGNTFGLLRLFYDKDGISGLYRGWQFRTMQYIVQSIFTVMAMENLEKSSKKFK